MATLAGATLVTVCIIAIILSALVYRSQNFTSLKLKYRSGQVTESEDYLNRIFEQPRIIRWVTFDDSHSTELAKTHSMKLNDVVNMIKQGHYDRSRKSYLIVRNNGVDRFLERRGRSERAVETLNVLDEKYGEVAKLLKQQKYAEDKLEKAKAEKKAIESQFYLVAEDFGNLLSLDPEMRNYSTQPRMYKKGILKGLPVLANLPDNVRDYVMLGKVLKVIRAKVNLTGIDLHQAFVSQLDSLRKSTSDVLGNYETTVSEIKELDEKNRITDIKLRRYQRTIEGDLEIIILTLTQPRLCHSLGIPKSFICPDSSDFRTVPAELTNPETSQQAQLVTH